MITVIKRIEEPELEFKKKFNATAKNNIFLNSEFLPPPNKSNDRWSDGLIDSQLPLTDQDWIMFVMGNSQKAPPVLRLECNNGHCYTEFPVLPKHVIAAFFSFSISHLY